MTAFPGTNGDDSLVGTDSDDSFTPLLGNDFVNGLGGFDALTVDYGAIGGASTSTIYVTGLILNGVPTPGIFTGIFRSGNPGHQTAFGNIESLDLTAGQGNDSIVILSGGAIWAEGGMNLDGGGGSDRLQVDFTGYAGSTFLVSGSAVTSDRGSFSNWESYSLLFSGSSTVRTGAEADSVVLYGGASSVNTAAGADMIQSFGGSDSINGGAGSDRWIGYYQNATGPLTFAYSGTSGMLTGGTVLSGIERAELYAGAHDDVFIVDAFTNALLDGGSGIEELTIDYTGQGLYGNHSQSITSNGSGGFNGSVFSGTGGAITFRNIERIDYTGSAVHDELFVDASPLASGNAQLSLDGGAGNDWLRLDLSAFQNSVFIVSGTSATITRGTFTGWEQFEVQLGGGSNRFRGGAGDDFIESSGGADTIHGGAGSDSWTGNFAGSGIARTLHHANGEGTVSGGTVLTSIEGINFIGGTANDQANLAGSYDRSVDGREGTDTLRADYSGLGQSSIYDRTFSNSQIWSDGNGSFIGNLRHSTSIQTSFQNIERVFFVAEDSWDTLRVDAASLASASAYLNLDGGAGNDHLILDFSGLADMAFWFSGETARSTRGVFTNWENITVLFGTGANRATGGNGSDNFRGGAGNDSLSGAGSSDSLEGRDGDDILSGGLDDDWINGGTGIDTASYAGAAGGVAVSLLQGNMAQVTGGAGTDTLVEIENLTGSSFNDTLTGDGGANTINGSGGNDILNGDGGADLLLGGTGADVLDGGAGADSLQGQSGSDTYLVDHTGDIIIEAANEGIDLVQSFVSFTLGDHVENLNLVGTSGIEGRGNGLANTIRGNNAANLILGGGGNDKLHGLGGNDTLRGEAGDDWLQGGAGLDIHSGGAGADSFVFDDGDLAGAAFNTCDRILDFSAAAGDRIRLNLIDANTANGADDNVFSFIGTTAFSGSAGQLRFEVIAGNTYVQGDTDGDGGADFWIMLAGVHTLTAAAFTL